MHWQVILNKREVYNINAETKHEALILAVEGGLTPTNQNMEDFHILMIYRQNYIESEGDELTTV